MRVIHSLTLAAIGLVAASAQANIISNGGFESGGLSPWFQSSANAGTSGWQVVTTEKHTGAYSAQVQSNNRLTQALSDNPLGFDVIELSFWLRADTAVLVEVGYDDSTSDSFIASGVADTWVYQDLTASLDPAKRLSQVSIWGAGSGGAIPDPVIYVDDFTLTANPVPEPATLAVLALGAAAMVRRRRAR